MKKTAIALCLLLFVFGSVAPAGEEAPPPEPEEKAPAPEAVDPALEAKILALVKDIGDPDFDVREKASASLKQIGEPALEILRESAKTTSDAEVKVRARDAIRHIEEKIREAEEAKIPKVEVGPLVSQSVSIVNGERLTWGKDAQGHVLLRYPDPKTGKEKEATALSWKDFLNRHPEIAKRYEVTQTGPQSRGIRFGVGVQLAGPGIKIKKKKKKLTSILLKDLGLVVEEVSEVLRYHLAIGAGKGVLVKTVFTGGLASELGIKKYDILLTFDGNEIKGLGNVQDASKTFEKVTVIQKGEKTVIAKKKEETEPAEEEGATEEGEQD